MSIPNLYITGVTKDTVGKTALCLGLALNFRDQGFKVGYFKPIGWKASLHEGKYVDSDAALMKYALEMEEDLEVINPIHLDYYHLEICKEMKIDELISSIRRCYQKISEDKDIVIIESLRQPCLCFSFNMSAIDIAKMLNSTILFVSSTCEDEGVDEILYEARMFRNEGLDCSGVVFNCVRRFIEERVNSIITPLLKEHKLNIWGKLPHSPSITAPTVQEIMEALNGKVLAGQKNLSKLVENILIGAMSPESAVKYFRKAPRKAVITGGDRPDIALTAMETDTSALILTGNLYPDVRVLAKAEEKEIPVILVPYDTFSTVKRIREVTGKIKAGDDKRIRITKSLVDRYIDWKGILSYLGLK